MKNPKAETAKELLEYAQDILSEVDERYFEAFRNGCSETLQDEKGNQVTGYYLTNDKKYYTLISVMYYGISGLKQYYVR